MRPVLVNRQIIERVVGLAVVETGQNITLAGFHVGLGETAATKIRSLGNDEVALGVEFHAVGHAARRAKDRGLPGLGIPLPDIAGLKVLAGGILAEFGEGDVAEVDHAIRAGRDAFGQHAAAVEDAVELGARCQYARFPRRRGKA
jgi:hypothetical protein